MIGGSDPGITDLRTGGAAALVRRLPLRWVDGDEGVAEDAVLARGWFRGADECARVLASHAALEVDKSTAFGAGWPILRDGSRAVAPALPVAVGPEATAGPDGEYRLGAKGVWREACGEDGLFIATDASRAIPGRPFDLLWFGDNERFVIRDRQLEIEDLFGVLRLPASAVRVDHLVIRSRRVDREILSGIPMGDGDRPQSIEVRRGRHLCGNQRWRDAAAFLAVRADIESVDPGGTTIEARTVGGNRIVFERAEVDRGWSLTLREGPYVFSEIRMGYSSRTISVFAAVGKEIDAMAPGMRGRLIFDLRTDLVTLGRDDQNL